MLLPVCRGAFDRRSDSGMVVRASLVAAVAAWALTAALSMLSAPASGSAAGGSAPLGPPIAGRMQGAASGRAILVKSARKRGAPPRVCSAGAICVGTAQAYPDLAAALAVARPGSVIEIVGGTYRESAAIGVAGLTLRGVAGRPHFDCTGLPLADGKSCLYLAADDITLDNLEISGAVLSDEAGGNGSCIRNAKHVSFKLRRISCHDSQEGLLTDGGRAVIERSEFYGNGWNGWTHNAYFSGDCIAVVVRGSTFRDARVGHEFKSRCPSNDISDSLFDSTRGSRNLDLSDGGETLLYRSTLIKAAGTDNAELVGFAPESCLHPGKMVLKDVAIINSNPNAAIHNFDKCRGEPIVLDHVTVAGLPVKEIGYIVRK